LEGLVIELYQQALKQHNNNPIGLAKSIQATHTAEGYNASCGDEITFQLQLSKNQLHINDLSFDCDCCAICKASASVLCQIANGQDVAWLKQQSALLTESLQQANEQSSIKKNLAQPLNFLLPIKQHISRINCALLPWQTALNAARQPLLQTQNQHTESI
jgi:nitrogen fixation protein NifU and related proteins